MKREILEMLPQNFSQLLRICRKYFMMFVLEPFDYVGKVINNKTNFPPLYLRHTVGPLRDFENGGAEFLLYLKLFCKIKPQEKILEIGCGCGKMALYLKEYLNFPVEYVGIDPMYDAIKWCKRKITCKYPNFTFYHIDIKNMLYNPKGKYTAKEYSFPFENSKFDIIFLSSVFTHMLPDGVDNYLKEISRLLSHKGRCLATFFLLNEKQEELAKKGLNKISFKFGQKEWKYAYKNNPEAAIAYDESYILSLLSKHNLALKQDIIYGRWTGREDEISFQDILLIGKKESENFKLAKG